MDEPAELDQCLPPDSSGTDLTNNRYARIIARMGEEHRLLSVHWELTYRCNCTCSHCYLDVLPAGAAVPDELSTDEAKGVVDQLAELGVLYLTFSGGEILARADFLEIAGYARRKGFALRLMTNGTLITPRMADRLAALYPTGVEISLYGADAATHEGITRSRGSFQKSVRAFQLLHQRGVHTVMKTPVMRENAGQIPALRRLAERLGAIFRCDPTITPKDDGDPAPLRHRLRHDELLELWRQELAADQFRPRPPVGPGDRSCGVGRCGLVIDPGGHVVPCLQIRTVAGSLRCQSLRRIWEGAPVFRELGSLTYSQLPACLSCELNRVCNRCHGLALLEGGDLHGPAGASCEVARARHLVLVEKGIVPVVATLSQAVWC
jgi:radical SAM protein with 4Fe4S-binding SPASM domain